MHDIFYFNNQWIFIKLHKSEIIHYYFREYNNNKNNKRIFKQPELNYNNFATKNVLKIIDGTIGIHVVEQHNAHGRFCFKMLSLPSPLSNRTLGVTVNDEARRVLTCLIEID